MLCRLTNRYRPFNIIISSPSASRQDPDAIIDPNEVVALPKTQAETVSEEAFRLVLKNGPQIELDHRVVYHTREYQRSPHAKFTLEFGSVDYELGRLLTCVFVMLGIQVGYLKVVEKSGCQALSLGCGLSHRMRTNIDRCVDLLLLSASCSLS